MTECLCIRQQKKCGKAYKFAHPFKGPYRVVKLFPNGAELSLVDKPNGSTIRVALNRLRRCPKEILDDPAEQDLFEELDGLAVIEDDSSEDMWDGLRTQEESIKKAESVQSDNTKSTRLTVRHRRDAITKDGDM